MSLITLTRAGICLDSIRHINEETKKSRAVGVKRLQFSVDNCCAKTTGCLGPQ